jgi:hypothetical protein
MLSPTTPTCGTPSSGERATSSHDGGLPLGSGVGGTAGCGGGMVRGLSTSLALRSGNKGAGSVRDLSTALRSAQETAGC